MSASRLPTLFISHGSPMMAVEPGTAGTHWQMLASSLPRPAAILMISAHWTTTQPTISAPATNQTIHDFGGFPDTLYQLSYPAPVAHELASRTQALLEHAGIPAHIDRQRGLDHGAWVPLMQMYPDADVPVIQLSVQPGQSPAWHLQLGAALSPLRDEGVLIIGSGGMTHNLRDVQFGVADDQAYEYVFAFQQWMADALSSDQTTPLAQYRTQAPGATRAHPTDEHLLPVFVARGAATGSATRLFNGISLAALALDVWCFD
ncbi:dioxygenase [Burkholderiaceae bacterium DAT-1]|nr:dioxygenase [Burkholderiaceae bacterium DAT-1]